jgi:lysophospholipase
MTFNLKYSNSKRNQIIRNGYNIITIGNSIVDSNWPACVGCAVLAHSLAHTCTGVLSKCKDCFERYYWNGMMNLTVPHTYEPELMISDAIRDSVPWLRAIEITLLVNILLLCL